MKLFVILAVVALSNAAKLDNTYLPPFNSQTSGGSGNFLQAPFSGSDQGLGQANGFERNNGFGQNGNGFSQNGNGFSQNGNGFAQNDAALNGNEFSQNGNAEYNNNFNNFGDVEARPERPQAAFERTAAILRQDNQNDGETYSYAYETENGIYAEENGVATNGVEAQGGYSYTGDDGQVYSVRYTADQNGFVPQGDHLPTPPPVPEEILKALEQNARDEAAGIYDDGSYSEGKYSNGEETYNNAEYANKNAYNNQNQYEGDDDSVVTTNALFRNSGSNGFNNGNANQESFNNGATSQAYLPPFAAQRDLSVNANQGAFNNGNANQAINNGATSQAYLPPFAVQRDSAVNANQGGFNNGASNQGSFNNGASNQGVNKAYLPPFAAQRDSAVNANQAGFINGASSQGGFNNGASSQGGFNNGASNQGVNKAYLPPLEAQRSSNGAGFGSRSRQPSFSARNGYRY